MMRGMVRQTGGDGPVTFWEPEVEVAIAGVNLEFTTVTAVVDTAFTGALALPSQIVQELGLTYQDERLVRLAAGRISVRIYGAAVSWFGQPRVVPVHETDDKPLIGNMLLNNCRLAIDFREGGDVTIEPLRQAAPA